MNVFFVVVEGFFLKKNIYLFIYLIIQLN